jgi:hypothetical protein
VHYLDGLRLVDRAERYEEAVVAIVVPISSAIEIATSR